MPSVTTARIIGRTWSSAAGSGAVAGVSTSVGRPGISCGTTGAPCATVAATSAMPSGLASTWPCPNPFSARCTGSGRGRHRAGDRRQRRHARSRRPGRAAAPRWSGRPGPARRRRWRTSCCTTGRRRVRSGTVPRSNRSSLGTGRPPMTVSPGQATGVSAAQAGLLDRGQRRDDLERRARREAAGERERPRRVGGAVLGDGEQVARSTAAPPRASPAAAPARRRPRRRSGSRGPAPTATVRARASAPPRRAWRPCCRRRRPTRPTSPGCRRAARRAPVRTAGSTWRANPASGREQPLRAGEPHAGQVVDRVLDRQVVGLAQHGDGVGAAVRGARRAVGDRLLR